MNSGFVSEFLLLTVKDKKNKDMMQKHNNLFFGFESISDFISSLLGIKNYFINSAFAFVATLTTFITSYVWDSASAVYFMFFLIAVDAITGIAKAIKNKTFSSARLPRILVITVSYCVLLAIAWNAAQYSIWFKFLPSVVFGGLIGTLIISILENFAILGIIERGLFYSLRDKITGLIKNLGNTNKTRKK